MSMTASIPQLTKLPAWQALEAHYPKVRELHLRKLFADDLKRGERMTAEAVGIYFDYSRHRITDETLRLLLQLPGESGLQARIDAMFRGEKINVTEKRAVLHVALRAPKGQSIVVDGQDVVPQVHAVLDKMADFSTRVRNGEWKGHTGKPIRNIINISIGGSDLGPVMAYETFRHFAAGIARPMRDIFFRQYSSGYTCMRFFLLCASLVSPLVFKASTCRAQYCIVSLGVSVPINVPPFLFLEGHQWDLYARLE